MKRIDRSGEHAPADELFRQLSSAPSPVARPGRDWGFVASVGGILILGLFLFLSLSKDREVRAQERPAAPTRQLTPPAPVTSTASLPVAPHLRQYPQPGAAAQPQTPIALPLPATGQSSDISARLRAPAMVVDFSGAPAGVTAGGPTAANVTPALHAGEGDDKASADERFAARVGAAAADTAYASRLRDTALVAPQGTMILAILETGLNSDLPGFVRAVVSRDVRGFDGSTVLIPRGSKLIGQYRSGVAAGQSRAFVVWSRVLTPEGVSIDIASPATDEAGNTGIKGETNTHFLRRFGSAILLSVLSAGLDAVTGTTDTSVVVGSSQEAANIASIALQRDIDIPPTVTVRQGTPIRAFVARDLDFSGVVARQPRTARP